MVMLEDLAPGFLEDNPSAHMEVQAAKCQALIHARRHRETLFLIHNTLTPLCIAHPFLKQRLKVFPSPCTTLKLLHQQSLCLSSGAWGATPLKYVGCRKAHQRLHPEAGSPAGIDVSLAAVTVY